MASIFKDTTCEVRTSARSWGAAEFCKVCGTGVTLQNIEFNPLIVGIQITHEQLDFVAVT